MYNLCGPRDLHGPGGCVTHVTFMCDSCDPRDTQCCRVGPIPSDHPNERVPRDVQRGDGGGGGDDGGRKEAFIPIPAGVSRCERSHITIIEHSHRRVTVV